MGKKKGSRGKDYFGMGRLISIIFAIIPVVIMFMSIEKNLTEGLTAGGVKG